MYKMLESSSLPIHFEFGSEKPVHNVDDKPLCCTCVSEVFGNALYVIGSNLFLKAQNGIFRVKNGEISCPERQHFILVIINLVYWEFRLLQEGNNRAVISYLEKVRKYEIMGRIHRQICFPDEAVD